MVNEILCKKDKYLKKIPLSESKEVFNDKKLNLKKYKYFEHEDHEFKENEV